MVGGGGVVVFRRGRRGDGAGCVDKHQVLGERGGLRQQMTLRIERQRRAVEDQAVVAAHLVDHDHGDAIAMGDGGQHLAADAALTVPEGRRGEIDVHRGLLAHQLLHGIDAVEPPRPEILVVPGIFADGDGEARAVQLDHVLRPGRRKVALLVEYVVEGQQALVLLDDQPAAVEQHGGVDGGLAGVALGRERHARQHRCGQRARGFRELVDSRAAAGQEARLFKKIGGWVAADGQLGEDGQARALLGGAAAEGDDFFEVSREIPDGGIDLGQCNLHSFSLVPSGDEAGAKRPIWAGPSFLGADAGVPPICAIG